MTKAFSQILYFDNHIVVANKPAGICTESLEEKSFEDEIGEWVKEKFAKKGRVFLRAAHRLDKLASGVVVFAKTTKALQRLHEAFRLGLTKKTYLALVEGVMPDSKGALEHYLVQEKFFAKVSSLQDPRAKKAMLSYSVRKEGKGRSLLEVHLHTGRYHQIRVQLASIGHPIVNDGKYGGALVCESGKIALHHQVLEIPHPTSKEKLVFSAALPDYWDLWM
jgi:23S rRNA pseudouridine1911/1915/1917 synthase